MAGRPASRVDDNPLVGICVLMITGVLAWITLGVFVFGTLILAWIVSTK